MKHITLFLFAIASTLTLDAQTARDYFSKGSHLFDQGLYTESISYYDKAIEMEKASVNPMTLLSAYMGKGRALTELKRYDEAVAAFDAVVKTDPKEFHAAYRFMGQAKMYKGDVDGAIQAFTQAVTQEGRDQEAYYLRGLLYKKQGKNAEACSDMQRSSQLGNPEARKEALTLCK